MARWKHSMGYLGISCNTMWGRHEAWRVFWNLDRSWLQTENEKPYEKGKNLQNTNRHCWECGNDLEEWQNDVIVRDQGTCPKDQISETWEWLKGIDQKDQMTSEMFFQTASSSKVGKVCVWLNI
jgi:hypothetical protein